MSKGDWKKREGVVFSTNSEFSYQYEQNEEAATLPPAKQNLRVQLDTSGRGGKVVTLITGFVGTQKDLDDLAKMLKTKCGTGGSAKNGEVLIQGDVREKAVQILMQGGYRAKKSG